MNTPKLFATILLSINVCIAHGQSTKTSVNYFDNAIMVDSSSVIIIPVRYDTDILSSDKVTLWADYYANIVFYNFQTDSTQKLFEKDTYILSFKSRNASFKYESHSQNKYNTNNQVFYRVCNFDRNGNGKVDNDDPAILYVSDIHGNNLKPLTDQNENVVSFEIFEKQNFVLIKIQRDQDKDMDFEKSDKDFYFVKLDLLTMTFGNKIEVK